MPSKAFVPSPALLTCHTRTQTLRKTLGIENQETSRGFWFKMARLERRCVRSRTPKPLWACSDFLSLLFCPACCCITGQHSILCCTFCSMSSFISQLLIFKPPSPIRMVRMSPPNRPLASVFIPTHANVFDYFSYKS